MVGGNDEFLDEREGHPENVHAGSSDVGRDVDPPPHLLIKFIFIK